MIELHGDYLHRNSPNFGLDFLGAKRGRGNSLVPIYTVELKEAGDSLGAYRMLMSLLAADLRCLDAHAHLGNFVFDHSPEKAIRHYEVGVRIGELSLGEGFNGVLHWGHINNRPFLRCVHGYGLCLSHLGRPKERPDEVFTRMLWLNPTDNQGVRFLLGEVKERKVVTMT